MAPLLRAASILTLLVSVLAGGCSKAGSVVESRPLAADFDAYRTGAVEVVPEGLEGGQRMSERLLAYLEKELKANGVLSPLPVDQGAQLIVRVRHAATNLGEEDVRVICDFIDARTRETFGQLSISANGLGENDGASMRRVAGSIVTYMRSNRHASPAAKGHRVASSPSALPTPVAATAPAAGVASSGACTTTCTPDASSAVAPEEQTRIAEAFQPMLKQMRLCLDRVNAESIQPAVLLRFEANGLLSGLRVDAGGYETLACVEDARSRPPQVGISRAASLRCGYRCTR